MLREKIRVLFIGGCARSGSTLVDRLFGQQDGFISLGEVRHIWRRGYQENQLCGCGVPFGDCTFWRSVTERAFSGQPTCDFGLMLRLQRQVAFTRHFPQLLFPSLRTRRYREAFNMYTEALWHLYSAIQEVSGESILVDSSKAASHAWALSHAPGVELHVLHVVRDPRAVAYSKQRKRPKPDVPEKTTYLPRRGAVNSTRRWIVSNLLTSSLAAVAASYTVLRYEDLATNPEATLRAVLGQAGLGSLRAGTFGEDNQVMLRVDHTVSGNPMRFKSGELIIRRDEEWQQSLPRLRSSLIRLVTYPLAAHYDRKSIMRGG